jgi:hypothetical protein
MYAGGELDQLKMSVDCAKLGACGYIAKTSTVDQVNYGAEICSTGGGPETFTFSGFHVVSARQ